MYILKIPLAHTIAREYVTFYRNPKQPGDANYQLEQSIKNLVEETLETRKDNKVDVYMKAAL